MARSSKRSVLQKVDSLIQKAQEEAKSIESTNASQTKAARKIDTSQFEPSWNDDDIDNLFQPAIHWKTIIETGRKARRKMEHCSAKMYEYETKLRQEALELQKDSNLPDSPSKLSHFEPYRKAFIDFQNTQTALDSLNKMSDQVYDQVQNAIHNSLRSARPLMETLSDPVEKNWLNSVNASLVLQSSVNDFYDALASKVREPSDNHDNFNQRMLSAWRNAHIQRETFLRCSSMVLDALRSGASSMDPRTPWSKVKELGKLDQIDRVTYGTISEPLPESIDGTTGMPKGKCSVWSLGILTSTSEDGDLKIQPQARLSMYSDSFTAPDSPTFESIPWLNAPMPEGDWRPYDGCSIHTGALHINTGPISHLSQNLAAELNAMGKQWNETMRDASQKFESSVFSLGMEGKVDVDRINKIIRLENQEWLLGQAEEYFDHVVTDIWDKHDADVRSVQEEQVEYIRSQLRDLGLTSQQTAERWIETAQAVSEMELNEGRDIILYTLTMTASSEELQDTLREEQKLIQSTYKSRMKNLRQSRRSLNDLFTDNGFTLPVPNSAGSLMKLLRQREEKKEKTQDIADHSDFTAEEEQMVNYVVPVSQFMQNSSSIAGEMAVVKDKIPPSNQKGLKMDKLAFKSDTAAGMSSLTGSAAKPILDSSVSSRPSTRSSSPESILSQSILDDMIGCTLTLEPLYHAMANQEEQSPVHPSVIELPIPCTTNSTIIADDDGDNSTIATPAIDGSAISAIPLVTTADVPQVSMLDETPLVSDIGEYLRSDSTTPISDNQAGAAQAVIDNKIHSGGAPFFSDTPYFSSNNVYIQPHWISHEIIDHETVKSTRYDGYVEYTRITVAPSIKTEDDIHRSAVEGGWNARQKERRRRGSASILERQPSRPIYPDYESDAE
ncbi:hypothetical protein LQV05_005486 [Cryptococcus neoformans]|nr:hypothetical protein LQV05_005486 [Cryptococcus neoformans]